MNKPKLIVFTGGGSGGPVSPLLALYDECKKQDIEADYWWLGGRQGPERQMVLAEGIEFRAIPAGKLRRYFSWRNFSDIFRILAAFVLCLYLFGRRRPAIVLSAGAYVSVPAVWAAYLWRIPVLIHQQDIRPGLANRLMAPAATLISVAFAKSLADYPAKSLWVGNPIRACFSALSVSRREAARKLGIDPDQKTVLVMGGGTGAGAINELVWQSLSSLEKFCQTIHITGRGKEAGKPGLIDRPAYRSFAFLDTAGMAKVFAAADIVVSRCGLGALTELSYLGKPSILIPMPDSHQEENVAVFREQEAALVLDQNSLDAAEFARSIKELIMDPSRQELYGNNIKKIIKPNGAAELTKIVLAVINGKNMAS